MTHASITAHKGHLVFTLNTHASIKDEVATSVDNPFSFGQVIMNTAKNLGVSEEALALLKTVPRGRDAVGDVGWFVTDRVGYAFSWIGGPCSVKKPEEIEGARDYMAASAPIDILKTFCVIIPNDVPAGAVSAINMSQEVGP